MIKRAFQFPDPSFTTVLFVFVSRLHASVSSFVTSVCNSTLTRPPKSKSCRSSPDRPIELELLVPVQAKMSWIRMTLALLLLAFTATAEVVPLTDATFTENVNSDDSLWFINFYAGWCPFSTMLAPAWEQLGADEEVRQAGVRIAAVDCSHGDEYGASMVTCRKNQVHGYPTFRIFFNGEKLTGDQDGDQNYYGDRDVESMKAFVLGMQTQMAPLKSPAATAGVNSTWEEAPWKSFGTVLKLFGF